MTKKILFMASQPVHLCLCPTRRPIVRLTMGLYSKMLYADIINPMPLICLKYLKLNTVNLDQREELLHIVSVLKSASNLVELVIETCDKDYKTQVPDRAEEFELLLGVVFIEGRMSLVVSVTAPLSHDSHHFRTHGSGGCFRANSLSSWGGGVDHGAQGVDDENPPVDRGDDNEDPPVDEENVAEDVAEDEDGDDDGQAPVVPEDGYGGGPSDLSLLHEYHKHRANQIWEATNSEAPILKKVMRSVANGKKIYFKSAEEYINNG
ncbi:hypothetical protein P8452_43392 [Trifolium repens]|nr:hypothetical protein P8452_43392 [Trifolium repens]